MYVERLIVVDARQVTAATMQEVADWAGGRVIGRTVQLPGGLSARIDEWITRTEKKVLDVMTADDFAERFVELTDEDFPAAREERPSKRRAAG